MLKLRKLLLQDKLYYVIVFISIIVLILRLSFSPQSIYSPNTSEVIGRITRIEEKENLTTYEIKGTEKVIATISKKNRYHLGDTIKVKGIFQKPSNNTTKYLFNYREYLKRKRIFYLIKIEKITLLKENKNLFWKSKERIKLFLPQNAYVYTFILGDKSYIKDEVIRSYQTNGISHLFAISGMHITLLSAILKKLIEKHLKEEKTYKVISLFLILYMFLVGLSPSVVRGILFYMLFEGNKIYYFYIKKENIFLLILSIAITMNPYNIYDIGFQYSYLISFSLLRLSHKLSSQNKVISLFKVSLTSFLVGIPISLKNNFEINLLGCIYNLFFVPLISILIFPFTLIIVLIRPLIPIYALCINFLEKTSLFLANISFGKIIFQRLPTGIYWFYGILIVVYLITNKKELKIILGICLLIHLLIPYIIHTTYIEVIDVGQGDSIFMHSNQKNILMDTGGERKQKSVFYETLSPYLKSRGISKIHYLILTHGDFDHCGEAINLLNNFKVEKVIFNCGKFNELETDLIKVLNKKKISYYSCIKELNIDDNKLYFLQTKEYDNENDNSNVIYTEINGYKFMFMGDAGVEKEKDILEKYNISNIDVLKVGHHGSKTSSSEKFINEMNPRYSIISVGKNNRYGHPNKEVLENLEDSKIYRTDKDGSIMFMIKNNKLKIENCSP